MKKIFKKYILISLLGSFILTGCFSENKDIQSNNATESLPPLKVSTYQVKLSDIPVSLEYPAKIKAMQQVNVIAKVNGTLEKKYFKEGNYVNKGDILYQIDSTRYEALMKGAEADVEIKIATLKQATREWKRVKILFEQNSTSEKERDKVLSSYEIAKASLKASQAALEKVKIDFNYTKVKAPISGIISLSNQDIGSYIDSSNESKKLTTITKMDPMYVEFSLPDIELLKKRFNLNNIKLPVSISFSDGSKYKQNGTLDFIDSFVDKETSTIKARATFENTEKELVSGLFVRIKIHDLIYKNAISIPQVSVLQDTLGTFVYIVKKNQAIKVPVKISEITNNKYIVESGLSENDIVITNNLTKIQAGSTIELMSKE